MEELYNALVEQGKYTKSFEDFKAQFSAPEKTKMLYESLNSSGDYTKSFENFTSQFGFSEKKNQVDTPSDGQEEVTESITETPTELGSLDSSQENVDIPVIPLVETDGDLSDPPVEIAEEAVEAPIDEYREQIRLYDEETARLLAANPNATEKELEAIFQREDVPSEELYEAIRIDDLAKEDLVVAGEKKTLLESSGYLEGASKFKNVLDTIDFDKKGINVNVTPEKQYMLRDEVTGELKPVKESDVNPELLEAIKLYEVANKDVVKNYDDAQVDFEDFKRDDIPDADKLDVLKINQEDYLKWDKVNTRQEGSVFKFFKTALTNQEGDEFEKEQRQYEKIQSYQATVLNRITANLEKNKALQKLTTDSDVLKDLKKEEESLVKSFYETLGTINSAIDLFPKFKELTDDTDLKKRRRLYYAAKQGGINEFEEGIRQKIRIGGGTVVNYAAKFFAGIPGFFDQRLASIGYDKKGLLSGLSDMISDSAEAYDIDYGATNRSSFIDGKPVTYKGEEFFVDSNGKVYDKNTNLLMDGIIGKDAIKEIQERSKNVPNAELQFTGGAVFDGTVGTLVNLFALIKSGSKVNKSLGLEKRLGKDLAGKVGMGLASFTSGVVDNVEDIRSQLMATGMSEKEAMNIAVNAGQAISTLDGIFSAIAGSNEKLLTGFQGIKDQIKNLALKKGKEFTGKQFQQKSVDLLKENAKELFIEELPVYFSEKAINNLVNRHIGNDVLDDNVTRAGIVETAVMTIGATSSLGLRKLLTGNKRADLVRLTAGNIEDLQGTLDALVKDGSLTEKQASDAYTEIYNMQTAENKTKGTIVVSENMQEASDLLTQRQNLINQKQGLEGPLKENIDKRIADVDAQLNALYKRDKQQARDIIKGEQEVTVEITVTREEALESIKEKNEEANESGIAKVAETEENILKEQDRLIKQRQSELTFATQELQVNTKNLANLQQNLASAIAAKANPESIKKIRDSIEQTKQNINEANQTIKKYKDAISKPSTKEQVLPDAPTSTEGGKDSEVELQQVGEGDVEQVTPDTQIEEGETQTDKPSDTTTETDVEQVTETKKFQDSDVILKEETFTITDEDGSRKEVTVKTNLDGSLSTAKVKMFNADGTPIDTDFYSEDVSLADNDIIVRDGTTAEQQVEFIFAPGEEVIEKTSERSGNEINNPKKTAGLTTDQKQKLGIPTSTEGDMSVNKDSETQPSEVVYEMNKTDKKIWSKDFEIIDNRNGLELGKDAGKWVVYNKVTGESVDAKSKKDAKDIVNNAPAYAGIFGDGTTVDSEMIVTPSTETKKESEGVSKLRDALRKSGTTVKRNTAEQISKLGKQIENAKKALSKILPDVEIIMPSSEAEYKRLTGESNTDNSGGTYIDGKIYINPNRASSRVVSHEVFHAVLLSKGMSEAQAKAITERMLSAVKKSASKELLDKIDKFSKRYPEALQSEESIAELVGILASEYDTLPKPSQNIVKRWLDKLAKIFGLKPFTDVEVVDLLNTLASKVESGQEVSAKDVKILKGKDSKQKTEARKSRNQGRDVISKKEAAKTIRHLSKKYGIEGALKDMGIFSSYGQFDRKYLEIKINSETTFDAEGNLTSSIKGTGNISRQTIFHEYLHPFVEILENSNKKLYNEIYNKALEQNKKENFFTNQDAYSENQQKEELVVRYLDRLSKNDKVPTLLQSFLDFISETLFKKKKNNRATLEKLSTKTSVEELYDIFKNYGNLKEDIAPIISRDNLKKDIKFAEELLKLAKQENLPQENIDTYQKDLDILNGVLEDTPQSRKSSSKPTIEEIVSKGKEIGSSDADIREVAQQEGYANKDTNSEIEKYDTKKREAAQKAEKLFVKGGKIAKSLDFLRRWALSARGFLPKSMQIGKEVLTGAVAANAKQAENNLKDLQRYINKQKKSVQDKLVQDLNSYMRGDADIDTLPAKLRPIAYAMRNHIDSLSMSLVESGAITDIKFDQLSPKQKKELIKEFGTEAEARKNYKSQKDNIIDNLGSYLNRSFEVFDNKDYSPSDAVLNAAKEKLREQYMEAAKEKAVEENNDVDAVLEEMVDNALKKILSREEGREFLNSSKLGSKNISVLKEKIDIPAEIRALMGEYTDPALNYVRSVNKIAALVANQEFLSEMKKAGEGVFFFNKPTGEYNVLIAPKGSKTYNPLNGMYTSKAIKDVVLNTPGATINDSVLNNLLNFYYKMVGIVKYSKTILSPATHAKNVIGNLFFMAYNGYTNPKVYFDAANVVFSDLRSKDKKNHREKMQEYIKAGIINQSSNLGEIRALLQNEGSLEDIMVKRMNSDSTLFERLNRIRKKIGKGAEATYQAEDDVFKIISFEMEKKRYSKALFNKTFDKLSPEQQKEVTDKVTEIVKNILPNYSRIGGIGKFLKAVPIAGTFISFQIEAMRTAYNVANLALSELKDINTAGIGVKRLTGILSVTALKAAILPMLGVAGQTLTEAIKSAIGDEEEEEEKEGDVITESARQFLPKWAENSNIIITKLDSGKFEYVNFSASDPHGFIDKAIISAFRGETAAEGMGNAVTSLIEPFVTPDILFKAITSTETDYGKKIFNETDTPNEIAKKIGGILYTTFEPGGATSARKLFKAYEDEDKSLKNEILGQTTGFKTHTVDFEKQLIFKSLDLRKRVDLASKDYSKAYYERKNKDISEDDLRERYNVSNEKYQSVMKEGVDLYKSALRLGSSRFKIERKMEGYKKLTLREFSYIRNGKIPKLQKKKRASILD